MGGSRLTRNIAIYLVFECIITLWGETCLKVIILDSTIFRFEKTISSA